MPRIAIARTKPRSRRRWRRSGSVSVLHRVADAMDLRGRVISKFFAVWFVVMIVLPFTPPFQAWDPHSPVSKAPTHDVSDKLPKDAATAVLIARVVPVHESVSLHVGSPVDRQEKRQARKAVLRV